MKNNTLITILTIIVLTLLVIVILGIYKFFETDNKLKETINLHDESIKEVLKLKDLIQNDYLVKSISSKKKEYSGNLLDGFKLNVEYEVQIKLIDENLNYLVEFENIPPHMDFENRLKNIEVLFFDSDNFELLRIDLSKPSNQYVNSETYHSSGKIKLTTEIYELIDSCRFSIYSLSEEEYLRQVQTRIKNSEDWSSFLSVGMDKEEVVKLIGEPDLENEIDENNIFTYSFDDFEYQLIFKNDGTLLQFDKVFYNIDINRNSRIMDPLELKWSKIKNGQYISKVRSILGPPTSIEKIRNSKVNKLKYTYKYDTTNLNGYIYFDKDSRVSIQVSPFLDTDSWNDFDQ